MNNRGFNMYLSMATGVTTMLLLLRAIELEGVVLIITFLIVIMIIMWIRELWLDKLIRRDKNDEVCF